MRLEVQCIHCCGARLTSPPESVAHARFPGIATFSHLLHSSCYDIEPEFRSLELTSKQLKFSMSWLLRMRYVLMGCQQVTIYVYNLLLNTIMLLQSVASHHLENTILLLKVNHQRVVRQLGTEVHIQRSKKSWILYNSNRSGDVAPLPSRKKQRSLLLHHLCHQHFHHNQAFHLHICYSHHHHLHNCYHHHLLHHHWHPLFNHLHHC